MSEKACNFAAESSSSLVPCRALKVSSTTLNIMRYFTGGMAGGVRGVTNSKVLGSCQTAGPIGTKFGTRLWIHLGMDLV